jgi:putative oxidoreductase
MIIQKLKHPNLGIVLIRLALGIVFIANGWAKFANMAGTISFFESIGIGAPIVYLISAVELFGGILMILGVGTRYVAALFAAIMFGAIATVKSNLGLVGGYEYELVLLLVSLAMVFIGGGRYKVWKCCGPNCEC